jgi:hypothetical protein
VEIGRCQKIQLSDFNQQVRVFSLQKRALAFWLKRYPRWLSPAEAKPGTKVRHANSLPSTIGYSRNMVTNDERMQRESSLIATIRRKLPEFAKACADDTELVLLHQDAFAADYQVRCCLLSEL